MTPVYLDNHATTALDPRVLEAMMPYLTERYGNAASRGHAFGWAADAAVDHAREQVAALIGASPSEIVFTSGATEADNLALKGLAGHYRERGSRIVTLPTEHKAVLDTCAHLADGGGEIVFVAPDRDGLVTPAQIADAVDDNTLVVSVMHVNNEIGVVLPIGEIAAAVKARNERTFVHSDMAQSLGKLPLRVSDSALDLVSLSAHKVYGPKGIGALWVRRRPRVRLAAQIHGGGHERGLRSGTLPVASIVGFGKACALAGAEMAAEQERVLALRERLRVELGRRLDGVTVNGSLTCRVAGNLNVSFAGVEAEALMMSLRDIAVSSGAACSSATREPSHVLHAIGVERELASSSIRFGIGRFNTEDEIDYVLGRVVEAVNKLRELLEPAKGSASGERNDDGVENVVPR